MRKVGWFSLGFVLMALSACPPAALADDAPAPGPAAVPQRERDLISILMDARKQYQAGNTANPAQDARMDMQIRVIGFMRQSQLAENWVGTVKTRGVTPEGNAWITVEISDGMTIGTWTTQRDDIQAGNSGPSPIHRCLQPCRKQNWARWSRSTPQS